MTRSVFIGITLASWLLAAGGLWLAGTQQYAIPFTNYILGLLAGQAFVIRQRETNMRIQTRWRFLCACVVFAAIALFISTIHVSPALDSNPIRTEAQAVLGGYIISQLLALPVLISCALRRSVS